MKTAISIPDPLFEEAEGLARRLRTSRSDLYARALKAYVGKHRTSKVTEQLNRVYATEAAEVDPLVDAMQWASITREDW